LAGPWRGLVNRVQWVSKLGGEVAIGVSANRFPESLRCLVALTGLLVSMGEQKHGVVAALRLLVLCDEASEQRHRLFVALGDGIGYAEVVRRIDRLRLRGVHRQETSELANGPLHVALSERGLPALERLLPNLVAHRFGPVIERLLLQRRDSGCI